MRALFLAFLIAGCVSLGGLQSQLNIGLPVYNLVEILDVKVEAFPSSVESGKQTTLGFTVDNDGNTTIENVKVQVTDPCVLSFTESTKNLGTMEPEDFEMWDWKATAGDISLDRVCEVRYKTSHDSTSFAFYDISAISEDEFSRLLKTDTLEQEIRLKHVKTKSPVDINIDISKTQPIVSGSEFLFHLQLINAGSGEAEISNIVVDYPDFLEVIECADFSNSGNTLSFSGVLDFINSQTETMTCNFRAKDDVHIKEIGSFEAATTYKYTQINKLNIEVMPS